MPKKKTDAGREYQVDGRRFTWHPLDDDDQTGTLEDVTIPLRLKVKLIYAMADQDMNNIATMRDLLEAIIPNQSEALGEMDLLDFQEMFNTWQMEYNALSGASLGE